MKQNKDRYREKHIKKLLEISLIYTNPKFDRTDIKTNKFGKHPQMGMYLMKNYPISFRLAIGYAYFTDDLGGINNSSLTAEGALLFSF